MSAAVWLLNEPLKTSTFGSTQCRDNSTTFYFFFSCATRLISNQFPHHMPSRRDQEVEHQRGNVDPVEIPRKPEQTFYLTFILSIFCNVILFCWIITFGCCVNFEVPNKRHDREINRFTL